MSHDKPNIILIMADDMGYSDIGCFGSEIQTPHINGISDSGDDTHAGYDSVFRGCCVHKKLSPTLWFLTVV